MEFEIHPDRDAFEEQAREWPLVPVWAELLADVSTPVGLFPTLAGDGPGLILESVERSERWGRYSFVAGRSGRGDGRGRHGPSPSRRRARPADRRGLTTVEPSGGAARGRAPSPRAATRRSSSDHRWADGLCELRGRRAARRSPRAARRRRSVPADRPAARRPRRRVRPLAATAHPGRARAGRRLRRGGGRGRGARREGRGGRASPAAARRDRARRHARGGEHGRRALPRDRRELQGAHPGRRHLPGRAVAARDVPRARRRLPDLPPPARDEPRPVHVLRADARDGAGRLVAGAARAGRRPARLGATDRRHAPARADRDPRPAARTRAARRSEGTGGARDARGPGPQRPRPRVRRRAPSGRPS